MLGPDNYETHSGHGIQGTGSLSIRLHIPSSVTEQAGARVGTSLATTLTLRLTKDDLK